MDIPIELKERFCRDTKIPIDIHTEPLFGTRIQLYDRFYNTIERYNVFLKMIKERYTVYELESRATVKALRRGECSIIAASSSDPAIVDECSLKIRDDTDRNIVEEVTIDVTDMYLAIGAKREVVAEVLPATVDNRKISWSTTDKRVAIAAGGVISAIGLGECTITAISDKDKTKTATCTVKVTEEVAVESINFLYHQTQIEVGHSERLKVSSLPLEATDPDLNWRSSNNGIATVDAHGNVTGINRGSCAITVSSKADSSLQDICYVLVENFVKVSRIDLDRYEIDMKVGGIDKVTYTMFPEKATDKKVSWVSSNPAIAKVDANTGEITAIGRGDATIRAISHSDSSRIAECIVHVIPSLHVRDIEVDEHQTDLNVEETKNLTCTVSVGYDVSPNIQWRSSNVDLAIIESSDSEATLKSAVVHAQDYYNDYDDVKTRLVQQIKTSQGYRNFNAVDVESAWPIPCSCVRSTIYTPDMDGHTMIGIKIDKALFTPLFHYSPSIFNGLTPWENFVSSVGRTDNDHIIYSERLLEETMGCCNQSRIEAYGQYLLGNFYLSLIKPLVDAVGRDELGRPYAEMVFFSKDEVVIDVTKLTKIGQDPAYGYTNRMIKLYQDISSKSNGYSCPHAESPNHQPFPLKVRLFTLYKIKTEHQEGESETVVDGDKIEGYIENIYYQGNQPIEFIGADPCQLPMLMRCMSYESLQDDDRKFMHGGIIAQFIDDYKIHVPPISSIPDAPTLGNIAKS